MEQEDAIKDAHEEKGPHCGYDKTLANMQDGYY